jgi:hypothetical protein
LNIEDEGYTAQWLSQKPVDAFHEVLDDYASNGLEAVAAFETGCRGNFRQEGPMEELLSENSSYYPDECTYLRAENSGYSIAWERESPHNSITLSVDSSNTTPLEIYFAELWVDERSDSMDELVDDAIDIIEENI